MSLYTYMGEIITIERNQIGAFVCKCSFMKRIYIGYGKSEALRLFRAEIKQQLGGNGNV